MLIVPAGRRAGFYNQIFDAVVNNSVSRTGALSLMSGTMRFRRPPNALAVRRVGHRYVVEDVYN